MHIIAERLRGVSLDPYRELADRIVATAARAEFEEYLAADSAFHLALLKLTRNERLVELVAELRRQTRMVGLVSLGQTEELEKSSRETITCLIFWGGARRRRREVHDKTHWPRSRMVGRCLR